MKKTLALISTTAMLIGAAIIYGSLFKPEAEATEPRWFQLQQACNERYPDNEQHYQDCWLNQRLN